MNQALQSAIADAGVPPLNDTQLEQPAERTGTPAEEFEASKEPFVLKSHILTTSFAAITLTNGVVPGSLTGLDQMPTAIIRVEDAAGIEHGLHIFVEPGALKIGDGDNDVDAGWAEKSLAPKLLQAVIDMDFFGTGAMHYDDPVPTRWKTDTGEARAGWAMLPVEEQQVELKNDWIETTGAKLADTIVEALTQTPPVEEHGTVQVYYSHDNDKIGNEVARLDFITRRGHLKASIFIGDKPAPKDGDSKLGLAKMLAKSLGMPLPPELENATEMNEGCFCGKCNAGQLKVPFKSYSFDMMAVFKMPFPGAGEWFPEGFLEEEIKKAISGSLEKLTGFYADFIFN